MSEITGRLSTALADRYKIERRLGEGGMATVYLAEDVKHHRKVAIKVLKPAVAASLGTERFLREIETAARLTHPHILPLHDSGEAAGFLFYVMPYVEGESLRDRLNREKQLPLEDALRLAREIADALGAAHSQDVVHRDIKPENILLVKGHAVVADFGIALAVSAAGGERLTETGLAVGTPAYMSPEQASGETRLDGRSDIYSLGCVLYEMLGGDPPFTGSTPQAILARTLTEEPPSLHTVRPTVGPDLERTLRKALAKTPSDRFGTADQFREALDSATATAARPIAIRRGRALVWGVPAVAALVVAVVLWRFLGQPAADLDVNRIMVFPLVVTDPTVPPAAGEDVATMISHALDRAGGLRTIDGWKLLDEEERENVRAVSESRIRELARSRNAAFTLEGNLIRTGPDALTAVLAVRDVAGDSILTRSTAQGSVSSAWRAGLVALNRLMPVLIDGAPDIEAAFDDRAPAAIASFLRGEAAFRRVRAGEATARYANAVAVDSGFALAAIRGAQAAMWNHDIVSATAFIDRALSLPLSERDASLARALQAYRDGDGAVAVTELERALTLDPEFVAAWSQLGEAYTHLIVRRQRPDSIAEHAFRRALALDSSAVQPAFHLLETLYRRGDVAAAPPLLRRFLAAGPDARLERQVRLMVQCVTAGADGVDWRRWVEEEADVANAAALNLATGGGHPACAEAGFRATLAHDTVSERQAGRTWDAVKGVLAVLLGTGRGAEAVAFIDSTVAGGYPYVDRFYGIAAMLGAGSPERADTVARQRIAREDSSAVDAWYAGTWAAFRGDLVTLTAMVELAGRRAHQLELRADSAGRHGALDARLIRDEARYARLLERALVAHLTLARGDTSAALERLRQLTPNAPRLKEGARAWHFLEPLALEQLRLAQLLLATGATEEAFRVASVFDAPGVLGFVPYLPVSLELRIRAAERLNRREVAERLRARLVRLVGGAGTSS